MNPQFDHKFLEQYLAGKMSPVEKIAFEARLNGDNVLRAELEAMKRMRNDSSEDSKKIEKAVSLDQAAKQKERTEEERKEPVSASNDSKLESISSESPTIDKTNYWPYLLIAFLSFIALLYLTIYG